MSAELLVEAKAAPPLNVPKSSTTVKVSCIDTTSRLRLAMSEFLQPDYKGNPDLKGPSFSFLVEHPQQNLLFDLGIRTDWHNLPSYPKFVQLKWDIRVEKDVATILQEHDVDVGAGAIGAVVFSHHHWDHVGNAALFPKSTEVVVGPGFVEAHLPGFPKRQDSVLLESDFDGRQVREVGFDEHSIKIGRFRAHDYFGDGSFYLLDTPGHSVGHICGLARTSLNPDTFVFMGGDACHHGGEFKPNAYMPLPKSLEPVPLKWDASACPGHILQAIHPHNEANAPFYYVTKAFSHDKDIADWTLEGLGEFEAHPHVLVLLAHDATIVDPPMIDLYPESLNDWHMKDTARKIRWQFLSDFNAAVAAKQSGEAPFQWGQYP